MTSNYELEPSVKHRGPRLAAAHELVVAGSAGRQTSAMAKLGEIGNSTSLSGEMAKANPHHYKLPDEWALLCGREPLNHLGLKSDKLQVVYNNTTEPWADDAPHAHSSSDEVYIVIEGEMAVDVAGQIATVRAGEFLCVPAGTVHRLVNVVTPVKSFVIRGPSIDDKVIGP